MFPRRPLRDDIKREIRHRIADGRLPPGGRLHESQLAEELHVSRTPLREAMLGLEASGFLSSDLGRGFLVPELDRIQFLDLGTMLARLDSLALDISPNPATRSMMEMQNLLGRARLAAAGNVIDAASVTSGVLGTWASLAYADCPNKSLCADILRCEALCSRYWHAAVMEGFRPGTLLVGLENLLAALQGGRRTEAAIAWPAQRIEITEEAIRALP